MNIFMGTSDFGSRIKAERKKIGISQAQLAKKAGLSQGAISGMERNEQQSTRYISEVAKALGVSVSYLLDGKEYISHQVGSFDQFIIVGGDNAGQTPNPDDYVLVPQYDVTGACGAGTIVSDVTVKGSLVFRREWMRSLNMPEAHHLAVIYASGDSNYPFIEDGQVLLVNTLETTPVSGKMYLICIDGHLVIKRLINMVTHWVIRSDNPDKSTWPDIEITKNNMDLIDIQGRIVWRGGEM